ncbi:DUF7619 domain-containing protein [Flavobacterium collinsii]|uniref:Conserved leucine-rich repeat (LRR) protein containing a type A C-terminal secretion signal n=1 Tax=Flavobacterium collinsii TaxID=1114861 RepID=A0A9W4TH61_9FLAO|nr:T9SS type A sorting domain-containing protein [Flavobacterium collinsii]CAI2768105.1 conserved leucine-rich repeat (LRR) protein precursor containing a type A C-terminal secretion signal [Flavobacterium collinsii]
MSKNYLLLLTLCFFCSANSQTINIPDANFKAKLLEADVLNEIAQDKNQNNIKIDANGDGEIQLSEALNVYYLTVKESSISSVVGIKNFDNLIEFKCGQNNITSIDVSNMNNLLYLECYINQIVNLNLSGTSNLYELNCQENLLTTLNLSSVSKLTSLNCSVNQLTDLDVTVLPDLFSLFCGWNQLTELNLSNQNPTTFNALSCSKNNLSNLDIVRFNNLHTLHCSENPLTNLEISAYSTLGSLAYSETKISNFDVTKFPNLIYLSCSQTETTSLDLTGLVKLKILDCVQNKLTNLDVSTSINLESLSCTYNSLTNLDVTKLSKLGYLQIGNNQLESIDLKNLINLKDITIFDTALKDIDLSHSVSLEKVYISSNPLLESISIKNGSMEKEIQIAQNPKLKYVCTDEEQITKIENILRENGINDCNVNSYCSFTSGGDSFTIQGKNKNDADHNGCDVSDTPASFLKFKIDDGTKAGNFITNETGLYAIKVPAGSYTISPVFENSNYFTISPSSLQVEFPTTTSPFIQDFCLVPQGIRNDLEIITLPLEPARPGFIAKYKIVYKNKGNKTQSGTVNLSFNGAALKIISATEAISSQTQSNISWNFSNLKPFETREILLYLDVNSPIETPAINNGDILKYVATVISAETDEKPIDNTFELNQTVVGSYDPNDKTCLEGDVIKPELIGEYVHYMIRFENTGTYAAQNIVVKDMVDLSKFDISTLIPTSSSHSFVTKISEGNKVEFVFENISLPFDDAHNDGYVAFKIKTLPTLKVGDSFTNEANIYFDYNFPILTNKPTSTFKTLGTQDFSFSNYFNVYPNAVYDILNITAKNTIDIISMSVYNVLGQLEISVPNGKNTSTIDVSSLTTGNYILKVKTDKGISGVKFIKK